VKKSGTIAEALVRFILDEGLAEGDKLPSETELAARLGVGRNTVREALKELAGRNIVRIRQGSGTYVAYNAGLGADPLGLTFIPDKLKLMEDLLTVRILIEPPIAGMAARTATDEDIREILRLRDAVNSRIRAGDEYEEQDAAFHTAIAMSSKNTVVPRLIPIIHSTVTMLVDVTRKALAREAAAVHDDIALAIAERDAMAAQDAMHVHLLLNRQLVHKIVRQQSRDSSLSA